MILTLIGQEWQAQRREKTKELHRRRQEEDEEERRKIEEYRDIGMRLKGYPQEDVRNARKLVSSFIRAEEEVEEVQSPIHLNCCSLFLFFFFSFTPQIKFLRR